MIKINKYVEEETLLIHELEVGEAYLDDHGDLLLIAPDGEIVYFKKGSSVMVIYAENISPTFRFRKVDVELTVSAPTQTNKKTTK
jgi:hypothetical protein